MDRITLPTTKYYKIQLPKIEEEKLSKIEIFSGKVIFRDKCNQFKL